MFDELGGPAAGKRMALKVEGDPTLDELIDFFAADGLHIIDFEPA